MNNNCLFNTNKSISLSSTFYTLFFFSTIPNDPETTLLITTYWIQMTTIIAFILSKRSLLDQTISRMQAAHSNFNKNVNKELYLQIDRMTGSEITISLVMKRWLALVRKPLNLEMVTLVIFLLDVFKKAMVLNNIVFTDCLKVP